MPISDNSFKDLLGNIEDGVYFVDTDRKITYWNKGAETITGFTAEEVIGKHCSDNILIHVDDSGEQLCLGRCPLQKSIEQNCTVTSDIFLHHKEGYRVPITVKTIPLKDSLGETIGAVEIFKERTKNTNLIEQLKKMAFFDALTEVGNRRHAESNLKAKLAEKKRYGGSFGLLFIDIDNFKDVNDAFGHDTGDKVLKMVAQTVNKNVRPFDITSRWGGEEFLVMLEKIETKDLLSIAEKLRILISKSMILIEGRPISVTISLGATMAKENDTSKTLIDRADKLMYKSKLAGKNRITVD